MTPPWGEHGIPRMAPSGKPPPGSRPLLVIGQRYWSQVEPDHSPQLASLYAWLWAEFWKPAWKMAAALKGVARPVCAYSKVPSASSLATHGEGSG